MSRAPFFRGEPDVRRRSLIAACAKCLAERGTAGTSVRAICAEAGVSSGLLRHYFDGVEALIAATYRATGDRVASALAIAVDSAGASPRDRLLAYLTASFAPPISDPELLSTWLAFWSLTKSDPVIAALHAEIYHEYRRDLEALIADYQPVATENRLVSVALTALVDGLWLELSLGSAPFSADEASLLAERWLDTLLDAR